MRFCHIFTLLIALLCASCTPGGSTDITTNQSECELKILLPSASRTSLGNKGGDGKYPLYWSDDDCIAVNGVPSIGIEIDAHNSSMATFSFEKNKLEYPYTIVYPHNEFNSADHPKVVFPEEQNYVEGSFSSKSAPMYGSVESNSDFISLKHLSVVLRLEMCSAIEGIELSNITISSQEGKRLAGEFLVETNKGSVRPTANTVGSVIYSLPAGFKLSTDKNSVFFISLPATTLGVCKITFNTVNGGKMDMTWSPTNIKAGVVREFAPIVYQQNAIGTLIPMTIEEDSFQVRYPTVRGYVRDTSGNPIEGVAVSDGFSVVQTDKFGYYKMDIIQDAWYIYISVPAEYKIPTNSYGLPCFFKKYPAYSDQFNFTLEPLPGGKETEFMLFGFADPQVSKTTHIERFLKQPAPEIKSYSASLGKPCYGITLGDVISMGSTDLSKTILPAMRDAMHINNMGMPVFQVMGNHDNCYMTSKHPVTGKDLREINLNIQRMFEDTFGPVNYSFNRGDAHIVGMRNVQWKSGDDCATANTSTKFTKEQYDWLAADLAFVPKDKIVVLCVHVPLYNNGTIGDGSYRQEVLTLLDEFAEAHILSGHLHYMRNYDHTLVSSSPHKIYEHAQAAVDGASWTSNINGDGVPNGYGVYHFDGNTIKDWYYKGYAEGMNKRDYQIRLHRGNTITGAAISGANSNGTKGYYQFGYSDDILLANVFNSDTNWKVEVYEDGVYSGKMTSLSSYHGSVTYEELIGSFTYEDPKRVPAGTECGRDFWSIGILCGYLGMNNGGLYYKHCYQMWKYKLKNKNAKTIEVRATDRKGNIYTCSKITDGTDMTYALYNY